LSKSSVVLWGLVAGVAASMLWEFASIFFGCCWNCYVMRFLFFCLDLKALADSEAGLCVLADFMRLTASIKKISHDTWHGFRNNDNSHYNWKLLWNDKIEQSKWKEELKRNKNWSIGNNKEEEIGNNKQELINRE